MTITAVTLIQDGGRQSADERPRYQEIPFTDSYCVAVRFALGVDGRSSRHKRWRVLDTHVNSDGDYCGGFMKIRPNVIYGATDWRSKHVLDDFDRKITWILDLAYLDVSNKEP